MDSDLKVNNVESDLCLFYESDTLRVTLSLGGMVITSKKTINVLGLMFDSKLNWTNHVYNAVSISSKSLSALKIIRKFFTTKEFLMLLTSNYASVLYYNSEVWLIHSLSVSNKKLLLFTSSNALKVAYNYRFQFISYMDLHKIAGQATPSMLTNYKLA